MSIIPAAYRTDHQLYIPYPRNLNTKLLTGIAITEDNYQDIFKTSLKDLGIILLLPKKAPVSDIINCISHCQAYE